jgi:iron complex transport system substrate-binding protein
MMKRVLSLLPSATEIVYALGAEANLVGVTHECDFPPQARGKPQVTSAKINPSMESGEIDRLVREQLDASGSLYALDMELVRRLRPELVLTQQLCTVCAVGFETVRAAMRSLPDPPVVMNLEPRNLAEVFATFIDMARELGCSERGESLVNDCRAALDRIEPLASPARALFLEWLIPPFSAGHWMAELVEAAGAEPVLADRGSHSRQLEWSAIFDANFDALVISCCGFSVERTMHDVAACAELRELRARRPKLRVIVFDGNHFFSRPGPRLVESARLLNAALAGESPQEVDSSVESPFEEVGWGFR